MVCFIKLTIFTYLEVLVNLILSTMTAVSFVFKANAGINVNLKIKLINKEDMVIPLVLFPIIKAIVCMLRRKFE